MMTLHPPKETNNVEIFEEHIKQAVREFQINKSNSKPNNREEIYLPAMSQWLNKRIYAYVETFTKIKEGKLYCESVAGIQDFNGFNMDYRQITLVGAMNKSRISKVSLNSNEKSKIQLPAEYGQTWRGYAHFMLPNQEITVINFELPLQC